MRSRNAWGPLTPGQAAGLAHGSAARASNRAATLTRRCPWRRARPATSRNAGSPWSMKWSGSPRCRIGTAMPAAASASATALPAPPATTFSSTVTSASCSRASRAHELDVERLHEAHVGDRRVELLGGGERRMQHRPEREERDAVRALRRLAPDFALADRQRVHRGSIATPGPAAARIAHRRRRARASIAGVQHLPALVLVGRRHHRHVRQAAQVREVERADVRRAVGADDAGAVDREHDRQVLQHDVVDQLVVRALQERRVDRDHRLHAFARESRGERHRVLLGDADVEIAIREFLREAHEPRAFAHRRRDADDARIARRHVAQPVAEDLRVRRPWPAASPRCPPRDRTSSRRDRGSDPPRPSGSRSPSS